MKANKLRQLYLDFFKSKQHKIGDSAPIVMKDDPTLMFVNAGMNQFKDVLLGDASPVNLRLANSQKCLRVSGKHNDLEEVGHDTYHHTMFEMLGSWSFGDYFKEEAICWAWEFLVDVCELDSDRIYVTVFEGSDDDKLDKDSEAFDFWKKYLPEERIIDGSKKDNFWEMGATGPCGPCSEIHFDNRPDIKRKEISGQLLVNKDHPQVIEIWNLVFMQYNRFTDGTLKPLAKNHVDTGMGFERLAMIMQGVNSNYDTDIFQPIIQAVSRISSINYGEDESKDVAMRVIADHVRAVAFSISDGQLPSNTKAGYVIRRILRRALRYAYSFLDLKTPFMHELVEVLIAQMGLQFKGLKNQKHIIEQVIKKEEESFLRTLSEGLKRIDYMIQSGGVMSGEQAFELYDTYGFPGDLTALILSEKNLTFDQDEFDIAMSKQKKRSKKAGELKKGDWKVLIESDIQDFVGYSKLSAEIKITRYREVVSKEKVQYQLVFNVTPFYAEGGGQLGDSGIIQNKNETISILDTKKENNLIVHFTNELPNDLTEKFTAKVNIIDRKASERNHTATHLLQESLRSILGNHVVQKGSLVTPSYLRFDFTNFSKVQKSDLKKIEQDVNIKILENIVLNEHINLSLDAAKELGALMLFGEKYEDVVRMIEFGKSKELCGGTHVASTGEIGVFKILSETSISSGIRRIEALTGDYALHYLNEQESQLNDVRSLVKNRDLKSAVQQLLDENKNLEKKIAGLQQQNIANLKEEILASEVKIEGVRFIATEVNMLAEEMKNVSFSLRKEKNLAMVLGSDIDGKALLSIMLTDDLVAEGMNAASIIKEAAKEIKGGGGGQAFFATAGGLYPNGIIKALDRIKEIIFDNKKASD